MYFKHVSVKQYGIALPFSYKTTFEFKHSSDSIQIVPNFLCKKKTSEINMWIFIKWSELWHSKAQKFKITAEITKIDIESMEFTFSQNKPMSFLIENSHQPSIKI